MSINYFGVKVRDPKTIGPIVEGTAKDPEPVDGAAMREALLRTPLKESKTRGMFTWEGKNCYVSAHIFPAHVEVTHNASTSEAQLEVVGEVLFALHDEGLHVWDPGGGSWFPS